ncbi:phage tail protein [Paraglaciecola hydrolytica]|uniref:Phage tail protein n=2 Tax=Paraglaciecola hydrolytica TaxID=1799789 RepID=A0A136A5J4_9ALTE|nr:phage tail protein [Paraglaciecola hydrolytica]
MGVSQPVFASEPFLGQIQMVGFGFAPRGWAICDGQLLSIAQNTALFSLLGTTYGGNGQTTFALPDLRGRVAIQPGNGPGLSSYSWGQRGGVEHVTLTANQMPSHTHAATSTVSSISATLHGTDAAGDSATPSANSLASKSRTNIYSSNAPDVDLHADSISVEATVGTTLTNTGGSQSHENRMPYLAIYHVIALQGIYPSRN